MKRLLIAAALLLVAASAHARPEVVATTTNMAMLVKTVAGEQASVRVLAPPDRDPHYLQVRPNMMASLRRADLVVAVGAELEIGWLPAALQGAHNPRVQPGRDGYFEAAAQVELIDAHGVADRSLGDVHPAGNPHVYMDPIRMGQIAVALAERLGALDPANAETFRANAQAFRTQAHEHVAQWTRLAEGAPGAVLFHKDADYLMERLQVPVLGYVEPVAGVPPTPAHLHRLVSELKGKAGVILHTTYQPTQGPRFLERELGWESRQLPNSVPEGGDAEAYFEMIEAWVEALGGVGR